VNEQLLVVWKFMNVSFEVYEEGDLIHHHIDSSLLQSIS
jgi:hypothetical protein